METGELHATKSHKFYYLSDQQEDEAPMLLQTDSISGSGKSSDVMLEKKYITKLITGVPHASFDNQLAAKLDSIYESIEIWSLVYY